MELDPRAAAAGIRLVCHDSIGSTNAEALAHARAGERGPLWIVAGEQTAGRGRRGRSWHSPPGNLYASLLLTDPCPAERAPQLSFVAALAVYDALAQCVPVLGTRLKLKWPNDVLIDGAKAAGILIEGESMAGCFAAVIGIGVNVVSHPEGTTYPAVDLAGIGAEVAPQEVFRPLSGALQAWIDLWDQGAGFAAIRSAWVARAARIGELVVLQAGAETSGIFDGVDEAGRLLLRAADGTVRAFSAAEVQAGMRSSVGANS